MPAVTRATILILLPAFLIALIGTWIASYLLVNHDAAFFLNCADRLLHGEKLYQDFMDTNTPMIIFLSVVPVLLHMVSGLPLPESFFICAFILLWGSFYFAAVLLARHPAFARSLISTISFSILSYGLFVLPNTSHDYAQRELLMCSLFLPYVALTLNRLAGVAHNRYEQLMAGLLAGIGLCIKPYFILLFFAVEVFYAWEHHTLHFYRRLEALTIFAVLALYYSIMMVYLPDYFFVSVPHALHTLSAYQSPMSVIVFTAMLFTGFAFGCMLLAPRKSPHRQGMYLIAELVLAAATIFIIEKSNFGYHLMPETFFVLLLLVFIASISPKRLIILFSFGLACGFIFILSGANKISANIGNLKDQRELTLNMAEAIKPYSSVLFLTSSVAPGFPAITYAGTKSLLDYGCLCYVASVYEHDSVPILYHPPAEMSAGLRYFQDIAMKDMAKLPAAIVIDESYGQQAMPPDFDMLAHLLKDPRFPTLWAHYRYATAVYGAEQKFAVYERAD